MARLTLSAPQAIRVYTPHGGSLVYRPGTVAGGFYRTLEWLLKWRTDLFLFESSYIAALFRSQIGRPPAMVRVVHNGVGSAEFEPIAPRADATDLVCLGEMRPVKAFDVLIDALAQLKASGRRVTATIAGEGPRGREACRHKPRACGSPTRFAFSVTARRAQAFAMGRMLVIPSRAESLPYVVLEAAAAGVPIIATRVGGIPEIFGAAGRTTDRRPTTSTPWSARSAPRSTSRQRSDALAQLFKTRVREEFSLTAMVDGGIAAYREAIALRKLARFT